MILYLLDFNNYYNRTIKRYTTLSEYEPYVIDSIDNISLFAYANGLFTRHVLSEFDPNDNGFPNYALLCTDNGSIESRWFVMDSEYMRNGQFVIDLKRDVVADFYAAILNAPVFIEKATVKSINDIAIYNKEDMTFNQIKRAEQQLRDESNCAWVVGYIARNAYTGETAKTVTAEIPDTGAADITVNGISNYPYYAYSQQTGQVSLENIQYSVNIATTTGGILGVYDMVTFGFDASGNSTGDTIERVNKNTYQQSVQGPNLMVRWIEGVPYLIEAGQRVKTNVLLGYQQNISSINAAAAQGNTILAQSVIDELLAQNGKIIEDTSNSTFYQVKMEQIGTLPISVSSEYLLPQLTQYLDATELNGTPNDTTFTVSGGGNIYKFTLNSLVQTVSANITGTRYHLSDSPYDMFAIPYPVGDSITIYNNDLTLVPSISGDAALSIATAIGEASGNVYDIQLLPYCPVDYALTASGLNVGNALVTDIKDRNSNVVNVIFWARKSSRTFDIPVSLPQGNSIIDKKVYNETRKYRLCSPNYAAVEEFNPYMNLGVTKINVDFQYKPFNPYIHLNIEYNVYGLYGNNFHDSRGLICSGDFSLPQVTDAWATYQLQNKNYLSSFERSITNLETQQDVQRVMEGWQIATGTLSGAVSGALTGSIIGSAGIGAAIGGIGSLAGGIADKYYNDILRKESIDYTKDQFTYQLGNIKALPQTIAKTTALNPNYKYFPFIEQYGATPTEENALRNKLYYNGMTIMRIGTIGEFQHSNPTYIKGKLIRLEDFPEDTNVVAEIANELNKGVFI